MRRITPVLLSGFLALAAPCLAQDGSGTRFRDLDPEVNERLNTRNSIEFFVAADWVVDLGPDAAALDGWGFTLGAYAVPDKRDAEWQSKWGGSFSYFAAAGDETIKGRHVDETVDAGYVVLEYGLFREFGGKKFEAGIMGGLGVGAFFGESDDGTSVDASGNWDLVIQIKPTLIWKPSPNWHVFASYKFAYMTPFYNTTLIGYRAVSFLQSTLEVGVTWRF